VGQRRTPTGTVMRPLSCGFTAATGRTGMDQRAIACFDQALEDVGLAKVTEKSSRFWITSTRELFERV
jgi:hypothetical protein